MVLKLYYGTDSFDRELMGDDSYREEVWEHGEEPVAECDTLEEALRAADEEGLGVYFLYDGRDCLGAINSLHTPRYADRVAFYAYPGACDLVRDVTDELRMRADAHAGIYRVGSRYAHAGGEPCLTLDALASEVGVGMGPWSPGENTSDDWLEWFPSLEEAEAYHAGVAEAVRAGG